jgi:hypothetical protein
MLQGTSPSCAHHANASPLEHSSWTLLWKSKVTGKSFLEYSSHCQPHSDFHTCDDWNCVYATEIQVFVLQQIQYPSHYAHPNSTSPPPHDIMPKAFDPDPCFTPLGDVFQTRVYTNKHLFATPTQPREYNFTSGMEIRSRREICHFMRCGVPPQHPLSPWSIIWYNSKVTMFILFQGQKRCPSCWKNMACLKAILFGCFRSNSHSILASVLFPAPRRKKHHSKAVWNGRRKYHCLGCSLLREWVRQFKHYVSSRCNDVPPRSRFVRAVLFPPSPNLKIQVAHRA